MKAEIVEKRDGFAPSNVTVFEDVNYCEIKDGFVEIGKRTVERFGSHKTEQRGLFAADAVLRVIMEETNNG